MPPQKWIGSTGFTGILTVLQHILPETVSTVVKASDTEFLPGSVAQDPATTSQSMAAPV